MSNEVFEVPASQRNSLPVKILYVTEAKYDRDWHSINHTHHFTEILFVTKGKGTFIFSNNEVPLTEHDLIIINPNIEHTEKSTHGDGLEYIVLGLQDLAFTSQEDVNTQVTFFNFHGEKELYLFYLQQLINELRRQEPGYELIVQNIVEILLQKMIRRKSFTLEKSTSEKISKDIAFVKNHIKKHFREDLNLSILAEASHINKYYLAHSFKKLVGISPIEYLIQTRIRESKILLETTNFPISDISSMTGFSSQSFFAQSFKRVMNETPSQYRNKTNTNHKKKKRTK
ncbi:helix-turn-helix transcriptional regulator [Ferdinandcohnia quinoae]|uniref:AraC family transcriptional regulator n=1 Tax=Fredinandcohnia quinoae TaxID=2918902 RepID=A0AAW5E261_9BACI|nr:AraC family transcriptional regulator [Fredinandcohnia sp. SECRCQ15]MCH1624162.1 AraC family transcriptional regulator [Fredinandcohnia sp. SECRCQ15]